MSGGASNSTRSGNSLFLKLPREIRNLIYGFLPTPDSWRVDIHREPPFKLAEPQYSLPPDYPLICTCSTVRAELGEFFKATPTNPVSLTIHCNTADFSVDIFDHFMNSLTDESKDGLKTLVLVPERKRSYSIHWREVITSLLYFEKRLRKYPRIIVVIRFYCIEKVSAADWLSATLELRHMSKFGCNLRHRIRAPVAYHQFFVEAQSRGWEHPPVGRDVRFSILGEMPGAWIQARCNVTGSGCGTQLLEHAKSLWITGKCTCKACKSGLEPCALETLLEEPSARNASRPPDPAGPAGLWALPTASRPNKLATDAPSTKLTIENLKLWNEGCRKIADI
jgi:hypothetical protein